MKNFTLFSYSYLIIIKISFVMPSDYKKQKIKNLKIDVETHALLKAYCKEHGLKMFAFVERLIKEKCKIKKDIYGEE
tara:strand:- start:2424 stop:2654 length:231 start_codon:yes stop_codon:yes gene_type:complete